MRPSSIKHQFKGTKRPQDGHPDWISESFSAFRLTAALKTSLSAMNLLC